MLRSRLMIMANDDPFGVFVISAVDRPVRINEADTGNISCVTKWKTGRLYLTEI